MASNKHAIRTYSAEELRLLAAEGRLKGKGIERLTRVQSNTGYNRTISLSAFERKMARQACWADATQLLHTFLDLAHIHSPSRGEKQVAAYITDCLTNMGISNIDHDPYGNIIADLPATSPKATNLLFTAHMDCVYPGGKTPVQPIFTQTGEIHTDGANSLGADDKAGIAAILTTLNYIQDARLPHGEIRIVFTVQEELGYRGIKQIPASVLNGIHLVISMDPPVRVERDETAKMAVLHMPPAHPFVHLIKESARDCGFTPLILFDEDGYVGGDTICLSPLGALVADFCSTSRYAHTPKEHIRVTDLITQTNWMISTVERALNFDPSTLELRSVYGAEPIGALTGVRKQVPLTVDLLKDKRILAQTLHRRPGPQQVPVLVHLSALAPRIGDPDLLHDVVEAYTQCIRLDQVPQVLRDLTLALSHLATNLADVRPLEPLIDVAHEVIQRGGDDHARINALNFLAELYQKSRRVAVKNRLINIAILSLQSTSDALVEVSTQFLRANLDEAIHPLTVAFCNQTSSERMLSTHGRIVGGRSRAREATTRWTIIRQRILQLLLQEDRILPEMLEWIFANDGAATQKIAIGFIDPNQSTYIADRILRNLKSRRAGVQETAVHFVGTHRMVQAIDPLIDLLLTPYVCRNRSLVEWALDSIGTSALNTAVTRLGTDTEFAPFVRRLFNRHDRSTDSDFTALLPRLQTAYGTEFALDDPIHLTMLGHYLGDELTGLDDLSRWDKRRTIVFYDHVLRIYSKRAEFDRLVDLIDEADPQTRGRFAQMAIQKNVFEDPDFLALVSRENARFLEHLAMLETHISIKTVLSRLREFTSGAQVDIADPRDVEIYYLYLLKQSPQMPDRTRYLKHIQEANHRLFPPLKPYCKAFTIAGDRIEEVGTVDRERIRSLIDGLPSADNREHRLRSIFDLKHLAKRERNRLINNLAEAFDIDVAPYNTPQDRFEAIIKGIDFEFDAAYRPVPQVVFPLLMRVRMKHRNDAVINPMAEYAIEYALISHPEISDSFDAGETDLLLDSLNDLLTDRVFEAEGELAEDVFQELKDKHIKALSQFYTSQWKGIIRDLKKRFVSEREINLIIATETAMLEYDIEDEEDSNLLDTNLNRLIQVLFSPAIEQARRESNISEADGAKLLDTNFSRLMYALKIDGADLVAFHDRHREFFKLYTAVLRVRNLRQLKRIYREVYLILQDKLSFAGREHVGRPEQKKRLATGDPAQDRQEQQPDLPGYLKYTRKELGKLSKLMSDFVIESALDDRVDIVQHEITKLRQVVIGTSQILCAPSKDVSIIYRSWPGNDCNQGDIKQILSPDCSFYKIISDGLWKGYFTLVELQRRNKEGISQRAFLLDVLNFSGLKMENESFIKVLMHQVIQIAQSEGIQYVLTGPREEHLSNRDYIRRAFRKAFPPNGTEQNFVLMNTPTANFQSLNPNLTVAWKSPEAA